MKQRDALRTESAPSTAACDDRHAVASPSDAAAAADPDLAAALAAVAGEEGRSILLAVANGAYADLVTAWASSVAATGAPALLFALDEAAAAAATAAGVAAFRVDLPIPKAQQGIDSASNPSNHAVSALKFGLAGRVLALGYTAAVSDVDVLFLRNPFAEGQPLAPSSLDADLAASSDGWDAPSAYGWDDVHDEAALGWGRYAHSTRVMHLNSGLWCARPTRAAAEAVRLMASRVAAESTWDQSVFNEVLLLPSARGYASPGATVRVLEVESFVNSRVLWSRLGPAAVASGRVPSADEPTRPVAVHVNYHPDKLARLQAVASFYLDGDVRALEGLPVGSGV